MNNTMINFESLRCISYGLYIVCSGDKDKGNGYISNTVMQVTSEPAKFATCCNKDNFTAGLIQDKGTFSASVLEKEASSDIIRLFGFKSGKDTEKLDKVELKYGKTGVPIVTEGCIAFIECKVSETIDLGTHLMFIGELIDCGIIGTEREPMTYQYYRQVRKGVSPKNAPTYIDNSKIMEKTDKNSSKKYRCIVCGYIYDEAQEDIKFADLPDDWVCPVCGVDKSDFEEIS